MPDKKKKPMDFAEKKGMEYGIKSERKTLLGAMRRKAIRDAAKRTDVSAKRFSKGASAGINMLSKDKAAASRGGTMPAKKASSRPTRKEALAAGSRIPKRKPTPAELKRQAIIKARKK